MEQRDYFKRVHEVNYNQNTKCFFCKDHFADKKYENDVELYYWRGNIGIATNYDTTNVKIPRCKSCFRKHRYSWTISIYMFFLCLITLFYVLIKFDNSTDTVIEYIIITFVFLFLSMAFAYLNQKLFDAILSKFNKINSEEDSYYYTICRDLTAIGWRKLKPRYAKGN